MKSFNSEDSLARYLEIPLEELTRLADNAVREYRSFKVGSRSIDSPSERLKKVQRRINKRVLQEFDFPGHVHGAVQGRDPLTNAAAHLARRCVVRVDIRSFFPSVNNNQVFEVWLRTMGNGPAVARLLTMLTTFRGRLPQGAPSSSGLANLVLLGADSKIREQASQLGIDFERAAYTRFVDDLNFSGDNTESLITGTVQVLKEAGFSISRAKVDIMHSSQPQEVTGLTVNHPRGPSVSKSKRDAVRHRIFKIAKIQDSMKRERAITSVRGQIAQISRTNPGSARRLARLLDTKAKDFA